MSQAAAIPFECEKCPSDCTPVQVPGPAGTDGTDGLPGVGGANSYGVLLSGFTMPAINATVTAEVDSTAWMVESHGAVDGQVLVVEFAGSLMVVNIVDATHAELLNLGYTGNASGGTPIPVGSRVGVGGLAGGAGTTPGGALLAANNLSDLIDSTAARSHLALGALATLSTINNALWSGAALAVANGGTGATTAAAARTALGILGMGIQPSNGVTITGGSIAGTPISGSSGSFTTLNASGAAVLSGSVTIGGILTLTPSTLQTIGAGTAILKNAPKVRIVSTGGAVVSLATPSVAVGATDGDELLIQGTHDTNTVALQDAGTLVNSALRLGATSRVLGAGDTLRLSWDVALSRWVETSYTNLF